MSNYYDMVTPLYFGIAEDDWYLTNVNISQVEFEGIKDIGLKKAYLEGEKYYATWENGE